MKAETLVRKKLPQNSNVEVLVPNYKEPILPVVGGFGWYGLQAYNEKGQPMCHECGSFRDRLLGHAVKQHGLRSREYKARYGLLMGKRIVSTASHEKAHNRIMGDPLAVERLRRNARLAPLTPKGKPHSKQALEWQNRIDTCEMQLLRSLSTMSVANPGITKEQANRLRPGISELLRKRFGSFSKARQLVGLNANQSGPRRKPKTAILEDMCLFKGKHGRWPLWKDYAEHRMLYSHHALKGEGIVALRKEAQEMFNERQNNAAIRQAKAGEIERNNMGVSRR
jgi:hypothetical protein